MRFFLITIAISLLSPIMTQANQSANNLGICLTDSMNGKERKNLAKWIYLGMSAHSMIKPYSNISTKDIDDSNKYVGTLITRLMTEDCPKQASIAFEEGGSSAFEFAFGIVGKVAMQELMTESSVSQSLGAFEKYLDQDKFDKTFK